MSGLYPEEFGYGSKIDSALVELWPRYTPCHSPDQLAVIGLGGGGCNVLASFVDRTKLEHRSVAINTDTNDLNNTGVEDTILLGEPIVDGVDCHADAEWGRLAGMYNFEEVIDWIDSSRLVVVLVGLGGATGTGIITPLVKWLRQLQIVPVVFAITPASWEQNSRQDKAHNAIDAIQNLGVTIEFDLDFFDQTFDDEISITDFFENIDRYIIETLERTFSTPFEPDFTISNETDELGLIDYRDRITTCKRTILQDEGLIREIDSRMQGFLDSKDGEGEGDDETERG